MSVKVILEIICSEVEFQYNELNEYSEIVLIDKLKGEHIIESNKIKKEVFPIWLVKKIVKYER